MLASDERSSSKRDSGKRNRSKSLFTDEMQQVSEKETSCNYPLRRQSAIIDFKPKVSKWTKVKAAFKWEKANAIPSSEEKTGTNKNALAPINTEVAR